MDEINPVSDESLPIKADDSEIDETFEALKNELLAKNRSNAYFCKICGANVKFINIPIRCYHCHLPICRKCRSSGFCLFCFINLNSNAQKTLKLTKFLSLTFPIFTFFLIFQDWKLFILCESILCFFLLGGHFYTRFQILRHTSTIFDNSWINIIRSPPYHELLDPSLKKRYIPPSIIQNFYQKRLKREKKLLDWVTPSKDFSDAPLPFDHEEIDQSGISIQNSPTTPNFTGDVKSKQTQEPSYKLVNHPCPDCSQIIQFADFCPNCNKKFCPNCGLSTHPAASHCVCGFHFPALEDEFQKWAGTDEIEFISSKPPSSDSTNNLSS